MIVNLKQFQFNIEYLNGYNFFYYLKINYIFILYIYIYTRIIYFVASLSMVVGIFVTSSRKRPIYEARDLKLSFSCDLISKRVKTILFFGSRERES